MKSYFEEYHKPLGLIGSFAALAVAVIYFKFIPEEASVTSGVQEIILRYGHGLCWLLLAGVSFLWAAKGGGRHARILAYAALVAYVVFIGTLLFTKFA